MDAEAVEVEAAELAVVEAAEEGTVLELAAELAAELTLEVAAELAVELAFELVVVATISVTADSTALLAMMDDDEEEEVSTELELELEGSMSEELELLASKIDDSADERADESGIVEVAGDAAGISLEALLPLTTELIAEETDAAEERMEEATADAVDERVLVADAAEPEEPSDS